MSDFFYLRVSTQGKRGNGQEQTFERQISVFERAGYLLTEENCFSEHISGKTKSNERAEFDKMLSVLKKGDTVHFTETSRFSRSYVNGMEMIDELIYDYEVNVVFVSNGMRLEAGEKLNPYNWMVISQMLLNDEFQRRLIGYNTSNALQAKKSQGKKLGRKKVYDEDIELKVMAERAKGASQRAIAQMFDIGLGTVNTIIKNNAVEA